MFGFYDIVSAPVGKKRMYTLNESATLVEAIIRARELLVRSPSFERFEIELGRTVVAVVGPGAELKVIASPHGLKAVL